jgi:hypothetical protein
MTTQQLHLFNGLAILILVVVSLLTRATARRIAGALAGGAAAGVVVLGMAALGEEVGWWRFSITWELVHEALPGVGRLRAGGGARPGYLRDLHPLSARRTRGDAAGRRSGPGKSIGPTAVGGRRTIRCN